ncbi:DUF6207 family protein [Streptomyces ruber]|uniref:DUF6207 family protein n=1 Tax=Streptomyces ruber TaxID=83378 RepID=UPI00227D79E2|nr:DUF6207 family protein [Streptomyces ruber]
MRDVRLAEPGLAVVDVAAADEETTLAVQAALAARWTTAIAGRATRTPGDSGVGIGRKRPAGSGHMFLGGGYIQSSGRTATRGDGW